MHDIEWNTEKQLSMALAEKVVSTNSTWAGCKDGGMYSYLFLRIPMYSHVFPCIPMYSMYSHVFSRVFLIPMYSYVFLCIPRGARYGTLSIRLGVKVLGAPSTLSCEDK